MLQLSKVHLQELSCIDDDDSVLYLQNREVGDVRMMVYYQFHLRAKETLPEDMDVLRFNSITRKDYVSFVNHPDTIA